MTPRSARIGRSSTATSHSQYCIHWESILPQEAGILALPPFLPSSNPSSLPLPPLWLSTPLRKQSRAGQVHHARSQALGERREGACVALCPAIRGQGNRPQTFEPATVGSIVNAILPWLAPVTTWTDRVP